MVGAEGGDRRSQGSTWCLLRPQLPTGIRHPEELSLLRAPEKKEKKKKEKEPEEEVYDLTKVILAGGEHWLGGPGAGCRGQAHEAQGWGQGLIDCNLLSRSGTCLIPGNASPLLRQRADGGLLPHAEPATATT